MREASRSCLVESSKGHTIRLVLDARHPLEIAIDASSVKNPAADCENEVQEGARDSF